MLSQELTLFDIPETKLQNKSITSTAKKFDISPKQYAALDKSLSALYPTQQESQIEKVKKHLGTLASELSDEQIEELTTKFQYLIDSWLDEFERKTFQGRTLQEVLGGK